MARNGEDNNNMTGTMKWLMGIIASLFVLGTSFLLTALSGNINALDTEVDVLRVDVATIKAQHIQLEALVVEMRQEQKATGIRLADTITKASTLELKQQLLEDRYKTISERILSINQRLDKISPQSQGYTPRDQSGDLDFHFFDYGDESCAPWDQIQCVNYKIEELQLRLGALEMYYELAQDIKLQETIYLDYRDIK